jgi:hypothetical protein
MDHIAFLIYLTRSHSTGVSFLLQKPSSGKVLFPTAETFQREYGTFSNFKRGWSIHICTINLMVQICNSWLSLDSLFKLSVISVPVHLKETRDRMSAAFGSVVKNL